MTVRPSPPPENHRQQFAVTGQTLDEVRFIAEGMAEDYYGASFEPLLTWSKAVPHYVQAEGGRQRRDGWKVTFQYRCRPRPLPERTTNAPADPTPTPAAGDEPPPDDLEHAEPEPQEQPA